MGYYLKWSASTGDKNTNTELLQISGISGTMTNISYTVKSNGTAYVINRYIYDVRRNLDTTTGSGQTSYLLQHLGGGINSTGTSNHKINGSAASPIDLFENYVVDDVLSFDTNIAPSEGVISIGARVNEVECFPDLTISEITITDGGGAHTIDMSDSGGTGSQWTSTDSALTAKLFNFPTDDSQWVFYSTGIEQSVGLVTETDSTFSIGKAKAKAIGLSSTTDSALVLSTAIVQAVGLVSETNATFALNSTKAKAVGLNTETNAALSITAAKALSAALASEANATFALASSKAKSTGQASETSATFGLTAAKASSVGLTSETNAAFSVTAITPGGATVGLATDTNTALSTTAAKVKAVGIANDTSASLPATAVKTVTVGQASTLDSAAQLAILKSLSVGLAQTTDTAIPLSIAQVIEVGLAIETNTALALSVGFPLASWVYTVPVEQRIISVSAEQRSYTVPVEQRVIEVTP